MEERDWRFLYMWLLLLPAQFGQWKRLNVVPLLLNRHGRRHLGYGNICYWNGVVLCRRHVPYRHCWHLCWLLRMLGSGHSLDCGCEGGTRMKRVRVTYIPRHYLRLWLWPGSWNLRGRELLLRQWRGLHMGCYYRGWLVIELKWRERKGLARASARGILGMGEGFGFTLWKRRYHLWWFHLGLCCGRESEGDGREVHGRFLNWWQDIREMRVHRKFRGRNATVLLFRGRLGRRKLVHLGRNNGREGVVRYRYTCGRRVAEYVRKRREGEHVILVERLDNRILLGLHLLSPLPLTLLQQRLPSWDILWRRSGHGFLLSGFHCRGLWLRVAETFRKDPLRGFGCQNYPRLARSFVQGAVGGCCMLVGFRGGVIRESA